MPSREIFTGVTCCLLVLALGQPFVGAQDAQPSEEVGYWLGQLESDSYAERQKASRELANAGVDSVRQIVDRMLNGPPESVVRCSRLLSRIALESSERDMTRIARILLVLSDNGFEHLRSESIRLNTRWKQARVEQTIERLGEVGVYVQPVEGFGGGDALLRSIALREIQGSTETPEQPDAVEAAPSTTDQPVLDNDSILNRVDAIVAASDEENEKSFEEEIASRTEGLPSPIAGQSNLQTDVSEIMFLGGEARVVVRGADGSIVIDGMSASRDETPHFVTIGEDFQGTAEDLRLLKLIPAITRLTVTGRDIDAMLLETIRENATLTYVSFENCTYDLAGVFKVMEQRPDLSISASGHNSFLGVQMQTIDNGDGTQGCQILEVVAGTAAEDAGCQAGDIIRKMNGVRIGAYEQLILAIGSFKPGDEVRIDVLRGEEELEFRVKLRERPPGQ